MSYRRFIHALTAGGLFLLIIAAPANALEPFAQDLQMRVVDPVDYNSALQKIMAFHRILAPSSSEHAFVSFMMRHGGPGILVLNADSLAIVDVLQADELGLNPSDRWRAATVVPTAVSSGALFCASSPAKSEEKQPIVKFVQIPANGNGKSHTVSLPFPEIPTAVAPNRGQHQLLVLTRPSNFAVRVDLAADEIVSVNRDIFPFISYEYPPGRCLKALADGQIYGSFKGRLFSHLPPETPEPQEPSDAEGTSDTSKSGFFAYLGLLPCEYGHLSQVALSAAASDGAGTLVGGTAADGYLFTVDTQTHQVKPWGKPTDGTEIRSLVHAGKTGYWGLAVTPGQTTRIFNFRPQEGTLKDHGVPAGTLKQGDRQWTWYAYRIADMAMLPDGRILLAEKTNQAKLLIFDPSKVVYKSEADH